MKHYLSIIMLVCAALIGGTCLAQKPGNSNRPPENLMKYTTKTQKGKKAKDDKTKENNPKKPETKKVKPQPQSQAVIELQPGETLPTPTDQLVIVDFFATWCGPCKSYGPIFDKVAQDYKGLATFVRVDVDKCPDIATLYNVSAVPTTVILSPDGTISKIVGLASEEQLTSNIDKLL